MCNRSQSSENWGDIEVLRAETLATREGLQLAMELGMKSIILEEDSRTMFEEFESSFWDLSYNGVLLHELYIMGLSLSGLRLNMFLCHAIK